MLVNNKMLAYRTTPSEKMLGKASKYSLIGYLEGIKKLVADSEQLVKEQEQKFADAVEKARAEVAKWEAEYVQLHTKALRGELKRKLTAPTRESHFLSGEEIRLPIRDEAVASEITELIKRRPDYSTYRIASGDVGAHFDIRYSRAWGMGNRTLTGANRLTAGRVQAWQDSLDSLIADLKSRSSEEVYLAQVMEIKQQVSSILTNWWIDVSKVEKKGKAKTKK